ncbi:hypothetical protein Peur_006044 [Populus x canadensis]
MESRGMQINILLGISYQAQNFIDDACFGWPKKATAKHVRSPLFILGSQRKMVVSSMSIAYLFQVDR